MGIDQKHNLHQHVLTGKIWAYFFVVLLCFAWLRYSAANPDIIFGAERFSSFPVDWKVPDYVLFASLAGILLLITVPFEPLTGLLVYIYLGYGFPRDAYFEFYLRWHILEFVALLSLLGFSLTAEKQKSLVKSMYMTEFLLFAALLIWILIASFFALKGGNYNPALNHHPILMLNAFILFYIASETILRRIHWWWFSITLGICLCIRMVIVPERVKLNGDLGVLLAMGIPLALLAVVAAKKWYGKALAGAISLFECLALYHTENRGGAVALLSAAAVAFLLLFFQAKRKIIMVGVTTVIIIAGAVFFVNTPYWVRIEAIWAGGPARLSVDSRLVIYKSGWKMFMANPVFGVGLGNFESRAGEYSAKGESDTSHNNILGMLGETGAIGGLLYLLMFGNTGIKLFLYSIRETRYTKKIIATLLLSTVIAYFMGGMFMTRHTFTLAYILLGAAIPLYRYHDT